jgi:hypothetical protein
MKKFVIAIVSILFLLTGCGPQQTQIPFGYAPMQYQPYPQQMVQPQQAQQMQYAPQPYQQPQFAQAPVQQVTQQVPVQPVQQPVVDAPQTNQPRIQNIGLQIRPTYKGTVAGCDLFQMDLDVGPVTMAKCKGFDGSPTFIQVSPATMERANLELKDKGKLVFNEQGQPAPGKEDFTANTN